MKRLFLTAAFLPFALALMMAMARADEEKAEEEEAQEEKTEVYTVPLQAPQAKPAAGEKKDEKADKDKADKEKKNKDDDSKIPAADRLGFQQAEVAAEMAELEQRMFRLGETLKSLEPENSSRLMIGLKFAREELILHQMKEIQEQLDKASLGESLIEQKQLLSKLERLEQLLLSSDLDFQMRLARLRQIREILRRLDPVIREEDREQKASALTAEQKDQAAELTRRKGILEELIRRQTAHVEGEGVLAEDSAAADARVGWTELAGEQAQTQLETAALAPPTATVAPPSAEVPAPAAAPPAVEEKPAAEDKPAASETVPTTKKRLPPKNQPVKRSLPSTSAATEEKPAAAQPAAVQPAPEAKPEAEPENQEQPADETKPSLVGESLAKASGAMLTAKAKLSSDEPVTAEPAMNEALAALKAALGQIETELDAIQPSLKSERFTAMAKDQSSNRQSTDAINELVRGLGDSGAAALAELIKSGGSMTRAEGDLRMEAAGAGKEQELALASLKYARELLAEEAARLQNQLRGEVKKRVLEGLAIMLDEQVVIRQSTESLSARVEQKSRQAEAAVIGLSRSEAKVIALADELVNLVEETEFGIALPAAMRVVRDEMDAVRGALAEAHAGPDVIGSEKQIETDLQDLMDAMKQMPSAGRDRSANANRARSNEEEERELNRLIAELRLVRLLESRLHDNTASTEKERAEATGLSATLRRKIMDLGGRQEDVHDVTERLAIERGDNPNQ